MTTETETETETETPTQNQTYTYPDGSQRVGSPPFPETSPLEDQAAAKAEEDERIMGETLSNVITADQVETSMTKEPGTAPVVKAPRKNAKAK